MTKLARFLPDRFTLAILAMLVFALVLPCRGESARLVALGGDVAIALLFFLQGARLARSAVLAGILHWRLHLVILLATFVAFPLVGLASRPLSGTVLAPTLYVGLVFLCTLPSTVQTSVVFTSIAGGNVAAALCSASLSSILGMVLTPLLVGLLLQANGKTSLSGLGSITLHLLLPFVLGHALQALIGTWMQRHRKLVGLVDRTSVLLVVYGAFSAATVAGTWSRLIPSDLLVLAIVAGLLLAAMMAGTGFAARRLGFSREDEVAIVFCGSNKGLVLGISMANALFAGASLGLVVLPLLVFHQMQLMAGAALARRYAIGQAMRGVSGTAKLALAIGLLSVLGTAGSASAQEFVTKRERIRVVTIATGLDHPWGLAFLPDGRKLVTERSGGLRIVEADGRLSPPLANVPKVYAQGQGGLLDVALDSEFERNRTLYLSYAEPGPGGAGTAVARARLENGSLADVAVIFRQEPKVQGSNHFGSRLVFARDGALFVTLGERYAYRERAQDLSTDLGKIVRINRDGTVPQDNPFVGRPGVRPEIWSYGHRNIQGAAIHPVTGVPWTHEHGAQGGDELNIPQAGLNYGWPVITLGIDYDGSKIGEGKAKAGMEQPIYSWTPSIAPSGMAFYTADAFPNWRGNLFVGSLKFGLLVRLELKGAAVTSEERLLQPIGERIRDVRTGPDGRLYLLTDSPNGRLLRVDPAG
jgi:glucose/arabinose dehydrogenase/predicted Na+-dependent transporter